MEEVSAPVARQGGARESGKGAGSSGRFPRRRFVNLRGRRGRVASALVEHFPLGIFVVEATRRSRRAFAIADANRAAQELTGLDLTSLYGRDVSEVFDTDVRGFDMSSEVAAVLRTGRAASFEHVSIDAPGAAKRTFAVQLFRAGKRTVGVAVEDVTDRAAATAALHHRALHDALTGLPNRVLLGDRARQGLREARRSQKEVALLLIDLNQFKEVNDRLGHHHGDRLLIGVASRMRDSLRECDTIARLGGDEFALLLTDGSGMAGARAVADKVLAALREPFDIDGMAIPVNASIGIAVSPHDGDDFESLARCADAAMYKAKRAGGGVAVYERELERDTTQRLTLAAELERAIESGELRLAYQPILDVHTRRVTRVEALVRWQHPNLGLLPPREFVDLAALSGMIRPLTTWVIDKGLAQVAEWRRLGIDLGVSVNLSAHNLFETALPGHIADRLRELDLPGDVLTVEINEAELMDDLRTALEVVGAMRSFGVRTSIDDFGTGSSSLATLPDLPINEIKIDGSFVMKLDGGDSTAANVVRSIADFGRSLGIDVVAEGVQSADALNLVGRLGCGFAQGYHIGPPMSAGAAGLVAAATQEGAPAIDIRE